MGCGTSTAKTSGPAKNGPEAGESTTEATIEVSNKPSYTSAEIRASLDEKVADASLSRDVKNDSNDAQRTPVHDSARHELAHASATQVPQHATDGETQLSAKSGSLPPVKEALGKMSKVNFPHILYFFKVLDAMSVRR